MSTYNPGAEMATLVDNGKASALYCNFSFPRNLYIYNVMTSRREVSTPRGGDTQ